MHLGVVRVVLAAQRLLAPGAGAFSELRVASREGPAGKHSIDNLGVEGPIMLRALRAKLVTLRMKP